MRSILRTSGWFLFAIIAAGVAVYALALVSLVVAAPPGETETGILSQVRDRPFWFLLHIGGGAVALLMSPWQFSGRIRNRWPRIHRITGRTYVTAILVGGTAGLVLAINSDAGPVAQWGFGMLAGFWLTTTATAFLFGWRRQIPSHRRWMIRSTALTLAAVTLRIYIPVTFMVLGPVFGITFEAAYPIIAWACWVPNLLIAEWYLTRGSVQSAFAAAK